MKCLVPQSKGGCLPASVPSGPLMPSPDSPVLSLEGYASKSVRQGLTANSRLSSKGLELNFLACTFCTSIIL